MARRAQGQRRRPHLPGQRDDHLRGQLAARWPSASSTSTTGTGCRPSSARRGMHSKLAYFAPHDPGYVARRLGGGGAQVLEHHQAAAQRFVAFLVSHQGQEIIAHSTASSTRSPPGSPPPSRRRPSTSCSPTRSASPSSVTAPTAVALLQEAAAAVIRRPGGRDAAERTRGPLTRTRWPRRRPRPSGRRSAPGPRRRQRRSWPPLLLLPLVFLLLEAARSAAPADRASFRQLDRPTCSGTPSASPSW